MMHCIIIDEADLPDAPTKFAPEGYQWAVTSNAGLPEDKWRLTFLPDSVFTNTAPHPPAKDGMPMTGREPKHIDELLREIANRPGDHGKDRA